MEITNTLHHNLNSNSHRVKIGIVSNSSRLNLNHIVSSHIHSHSKCHNTNHFIVNTSHHHHNTNNINLSDSPNHSNKEGITVHHRMDITNLLPMVFILNMLILMVVVDSPMDTTAITMQ